MIVHGPGAGPGPASGPRTTSSAVTAREKMRFVNQFESGTSSMVLMLRARTFCVMSPGCPKRFGTRSKKRPIGRACTREASWVSGSRAIGSSSKNLRVAADEEIVATMIAA